MKTSAEGFQQCYNAQVVVDEAHPLIVANNVGANASDQGSRGVGSALVVPCREAIDTPLNVLGTGPASQTRQAPIPAFGSPANSVTGQRPVPAAKTSTAQTPGQYLKSGQASGPQFRFLAWINASVSTIV